MEIQHGTIVEARTASGELVHMRAISGPTRGRDFPVVWVCTEEEYQRALKAEREPAGVPWPLNAVRAVERA